MPCANRVPMILPSNMRIKLQAAPLNAHACQPAYLTTVIKQSSARPPSFMPQ